MPDTAPLEDAPTPVELWLTQHPEIQAWEILIPEQCAMGWHRTLECTVYVSLNEVTGVFGYETAE